MSDVNQNDYVLVRVDKARLLLAEAKNAQQAKQVADMARAAEVFARRQKLSQEAITYAHSIQIDAMSMAGEFLQNAPMNEGTRMKGRDIGGTLWEPPTNDIPTLEQAGFTKKQSTDSQFLAKLKTDHPQVYEAIREGEKSVGQVQREVRKTELMARLISWPSQKFRVIYADPPWKYDSGSAGIDYYGPAGHHYPAMSISELCALDVVSLAANDAVLFLWVTSPMLDVCWPVIKTWGFEYKSSFVWDKVKHNYGHYNSVRHEFLLVSTRGSCTPDISELSDSVISIERTNQHSAKPNYFRDLIDKLYPHGKRIELFAREQIGNWEVWGNEIESRTVSKIS